MKSNWKEINIITLKEDEKAVLEDSKITIYRKEEDRLRKGEKDVTSECFTELCKSSSSKGSYVGIYHDGKKIFVLGLDERSYVFPYQDRRGYRMELAEGATVSFRVVKER